MDEAFSRTPSSLSRAIAALAPGAWLGRYELALRIRDDDAGTIWLAYETTKAGTERAVALRVASPRLSADGGFLPLLRQEVKLACGVAHPGLCQALESGTDGAVIFVASEWVEGATLAELRDVARADGRAIPTPILLRILADACAGLHAAHLLRDRTGSLLNVVHGDVAPASLLVATDGAARVMDLGFRKAAARRAGGANASWSASGTAPGQRIDRHADVWGIGAILAQELADVA